MVKHKWWNGSLTDDVIVAAISTTTPKNVRELAKDIEANDRYLNRRLKHLVEAGRIGRKLDIRRDPRAYVYLRRPEVVTTDAAVEVTS